MQALLNNVDIFSDLNRDPVLIIGLQHGFKVKQMNICVYRERV